MLGRVQPQRVGSPLWHWFAFVALTLLAAVACGPPPATVRPEQQLLPSPTPLPSPARLRIACGAGRAPARLALALAANLTRSGFAVENLCAATASPYPVPDVEGADLYLGYDPPSAWTASPVSTTQFVPVVSFWLPITDVSYQDLERIFAGDVASWRDLGCLWDEPIAPLAVANDPPAPLLPANGTVLPDVDALVAVFQGTPGGIALLPVPSVDFRVRALRVDGYDTLLEREPRAGAPLVRTLFVAVSPHAPSGAGERAKALLDERQIYPPEPAIEIAVVGDVVPGRMVERSILAYGGDYTRPFAHVAATLRSADLTIANLEGVLSDDIAPPEDPTTFFFVAAGRFAEGLRYAGIDGVSLANNHSMNFGAAGLADTLAILDAAGIAHFGAGMDLAEARRPALFHVHGVTFAFLGYDAISYELYGAGDSWAGTAPADPVRIAEDIARARTQADVVIPYFHWGWEYTAEPSPWQRELAHCAVDAGADLVLGDHPHWVQAFERYHDVPILYSPGNFVFDQMWSLETRRGVIWRLVFHGKRLVQIRLQAVQIEDYHQPRLLPPQEAEEVYRMIRAASPGWPVEEGVTR